MPYHSPQPAPGVVWPGTGRSLQLQVRGSSAPLPGNRGDGVVTGRGPWSAPGPRMLSLPGWDGALPLGDGASPLVGVGKPPFFKTSQAQVKLQSQKFGQVKPLIKSQDQNNFKSSLKSCLRVKNLLKSSLKSSRRVKIF